MSKKFFQPLQFYRVEVGGKNTDTGFGIPTGKNWTVKGRRNTKRKNGARTAQNGTT